MNVRNYLRKSPAGIIRYRIPISDIAVPKKTKSTSKQTEAVPERTAPDGGIPTEKPARRAPAKSKKTPKNGAKRPRTKLPAGAKKAAHPTDEEIRIRAYFISERRHRLALPGDATSDWEEARRQLLTETGPA
jgi:hypothetical protein